MLYRFEEDNRFLGNKYENGVSVCRVQNIQTVFYDMNNYGCAFDEDFRDITMDMQKILAYVETEEDKNNTIHSKVFINMDDGDTYELCMKKVDDVSDKFEER